MTTSRTSARRKSKPVSKKRGGWLSALLGSSGGIEERVQQSNALPNWEEFAHRQFEDHELSKIESRMAELPPHKPRISTPLYTNFLYFVTVSGVIAAGVYTPVLAPVLIYGAIGLSFVIGMLVIFRDGVFFHLESRRIRGDSTMINQRARRWGKAFSNQSTALGMGDYPTAFAPREDDASFRSKLMRIHYYNILRTFEQGNRRTWVEQDASIADVHTLLSQRGMKQVWTLIEVLPQLGLLGTLLGLMRMFFEFRLTTNIVDSAVTEGFGVALGTTVVANLMVIILRPLYMRNERSMYEILSEMRILMDMFILPTQQTIIGNASKGRPFSYTTPEYQEWHTSQKEEMSPLAPKPPSAQKSVDTKLEEHLGRIAQSMSAPKPNKVATSAKQTKPDLATDSAQKAPQSRLEKQVIKQTQGN